MAENSEAYIAAHLLTERITLSYDALVVGGDSLTERLAALDTAKSDNIASDYTLAHHAAGSAPSGSQLSCVIELVHAPVKSCRSAGARSGKLRN